MKILGHGKTSIQKDECLGLVIGLCRWWGLKGESGDSSLHRNAFGTVCQEMGRLRVEGSFLLGSQGIRDLRELSLPSLLGQMRAAIKLEQQLCGGGRMPKE